MSVIKSTTLWCQVGASDKVYKVAIVRWSDGSFHVVGANARRGLVYIEQPKGTHQSLARAEAEYDDIIRAKRRKGYEIRSTVPGALDWYYDAPTNPGATLKMPDWNAEPSTRPPVKPKPRPAPPPAPEPAPRNSRKVEEEAAEVKPEITRKSRTL